MKAKDYLKLYLDSHNKEMMLLKIASDFMKEATTLMESRKCGTTSAVKAVLLEINLKWVAFSKLAEDGSVKENGFRDLYRFKNHAFCKKIGF